MNRILSKKLDPHLMGRQVGLRIAKHEERHPIPYLLGRVAVTPPKNFTVKNRGLFLCGVFEQMNEIKRERCFSN